MRLPWMLATAIFFAVSPHTLPAQLRPWRPLFVSRTETLTNPSGSTVVSHTRFGRRGDGSWSRLEISKDPDGVERSHLEFADFTRLLSIRADPVTRSVSTFSISRNEVNALISSEPDFAPCDGREQRRDLPHGHLLGMDVVLLTDRFEGYQEARWVAPMLDCFPLEVTERNARWMVKDSVANMASPSQPPIWMFQAPAGYVERSPREIQSLYMRAIPGAEYLPPDLLEAAESRYHAGRR